MTVHKSYFTDISTATLEYSGSQDVMEDSFDPSDAETVTVDFSDEKSGEVVSKSYETTALDSPWNEFFDTEEYVTFDATVAQPIVQPYFYDGELQYFEKDETELRQAQPQIDNLPWTVDHPPKKRITSSEQIRGFWKDPEWNDGQQARLYVPANDTDALRYAVDNEGVSVGFVGELDWNDDPDSEVDAVQRDMAYDHIASVETGRCSEEDGCGLHNDEASSESSHDSHGYVITDAVQSLTTEEDDHSEVGGSTEWSEGDWVKFTVDGEQHHGKIVYVDAERSLVKQYDTEEQKLSSNATTLATSSLNDWVGPLVDSCPGDTCSCGCHITDSAQNDNQPSEDTDDTTTDSNMDLHEFIDENDYDAEQIIDELEVSVPDGPTAFYDGQPDVETLADDFTAVEVLVDEKDAVEADLQKANDELETYRRSQFEDKASELAELRDGRTEEGLLEAFEDGEMTVSDVEDEIAIVEDVRSSETTTVDSSGDGESTETTTDELPSTTRELERVKGGYDLRTQTN